jgi:two-component system nitrogen regulation sensor histidine kinase NtrY
VRGRFTPWWALSATATVLAGAVWLREPSVASVLAVAAALVWCAVVTWPARRNWPRVAFLGAGVVLLVMVGRAERERGIDASAPESAKAAVEARGAAALAKLLTDEAAALQRAANAALDLPSDARAAFEKVDKLREGSEQRAVTLVRGGAPFAWAGRLMAPVDSLAGPVGAVGTPFYLTLYAIAGRGADRAIAEAVIHAEPPADNLVTPLDRAVIAETGVAGFIYEDVTSAIRDSLTIVQLAGLPILGVRGVAPPADMLGARHLEHGKAQVGVALAVALLLLLAATWRGGGVPARLTGLGVAVATVMVVPLSTFSNVSRLFNPAFYYVAKGGPFTGSIGALAISSALLLMALLTALRARLRVSSRALAVVGVLLIASIGPIVLGDLARGVQVPTGGVTTGLWLAWQVTLFLAAVTVLLSGVASGRAALRGVIGLPLWIAPAIAAAAALLAPTVMQAPGAYPPYYPVLWVAAIVALAFGRAGRGAVLATTIVAACGATALTWGQVVRARVQMAERDVQGLRTADVEAAAYLQRFTAQLNPQRAPVNRLELLSDYAASDLSSGDFPVELTSWDAKGHITADLRVNVGPGVPTGLDALARAAASDRQPTIRTVVGIPGVYVVLSVPHADRSVTTVVVAPRTRLMARDPFGALIGMAPPPLTEPPYTLRSDDKRAANATGWERLQNELHGDFFLPEPNGPRVSRVHATVELRGYEALAPRGALIVLFDLLVFGVLWSLLVIADGVFFRWLRWQRRRWARSYRTQLTFALFAFFVMPAAAFAVWSYQRLQSDERQARDLLVRELLRGVAVTTDSLRLSEVAERFETPLLLFANGVMVGASDPILEALAPVGRLLPSAAARSLAERDDITAGSEELVGSAPVHFGYRSSEAGLAQLVLAAPSRTDDLALDRRSRDLGIFVLFATALGGLAALALSGFAARQLSLPIGTLQRGARALAAGEREPRLEADPPTEFQPVFTAFRQMARDLEASREQEARAQRVLAWGEMARQVAHEIKNPLTPMRLGMQHLRRARHDPRVDFDKVLDDNIARMLGEIDRLDEIARAFSRYGTVPTERLAAEPVDSAQVVRDVVELERMGEDGVRWEVVGCDEPAVAMARATELREVLLNLLENARLAEARVVTTTVALEGEVLTIVVADDGHGIPDAALPRIFEPHFSTRTSGSGLGLAISRRIIEGWGGTIGVTSSTLPGQAGTRVRIALVPARAI